MIVSVSHSSSANIIELTPADTRFGLPFVASKQTSELLLDQFPIHMKGDGVILLIDSMFIVMYLHSTPRFPASALSSYVHGGSM